MRNIIKLVAIAILFFDCQSKQQDYKVEEAMLDCFFSQYRDRGIDVSKSIDSANAILVGHHILPDISGKSFIAMLEDIRDSNGLPFKPNPELIDSLTAIRYLPSTLNCQDDFYLDFDSAALKNSKITVFIAIFGSVAREGDISVKKIADHLLQAFDAKDFDTPFYSTFGTLALCSLIKAHDDLEMLSALPPKKEFKDSSNAVLTFSMVEGDKLMLNGNEVDTSTVAKLVEYFAFENESSGIIKVSAKRNVSYHFYIHVIDNINQGYDKFYDQKSRDLFASDFKNISEEQQKEILTKYPKQISVSDPEF